MFHGSFLSFLFWFRMPSQRDKYAHRSKRRLLFPPRWIFRKGRTRMLRIPLDARPKKEEPFTLSKGLKQLASRVFQTRLKLFVARLLPVEIKRANLCNKAA
jgi:hypothetical protein